MFEHTTVYIALTKRQHLPFSSFWIRLPLVFQLITWREGKGNSKGFFLNSVWKGHKYIQNSVSKGHKYILEKEWEGALFCFITSLASPLHFVSSLLWPPTQNTNVLNKENEKQDRTDLLWPQLRIKDKLVSSPAISDCPRLLYASTSPHLGPVCILSLLVNTNENCDFYGLSLNDDKSCHEYKDIINRAILNHFKCQSHHDDNNEKPNNFWTKQVLVVISSHSHSHWYPCQCNMIQQWSYCQCCQW